MIINDSTGCRSVRGFEDSDLKEMRAYLLGAAQVWCRDRHGKWFAARDLLGGANYNWKGTPLQSLYNYYLKKRNRNDGYAEKQAGIAAGHLLKRALKDDPKRLYETRQGYTREYRWVDNEMP